MLPQRLHILYRATDGSMYELDLSKTDKDSVNECLERLYGASAPMHQEPLEGIKYREGRLVSTLHKSAFKVEQQEVVKPANLPIIPGKIGTYIYLSPLAYSKLPKYNWNSYVSPDGYPVYWQRNLGYHRIKYLKADELYQVYIGGSREYDDAIAYTNTLEEARKVRVNDAYESLLNGTLFKGEHSGLYDRYLQILERGEHIASSTPVGAPCVVQDVVLPYLHNKPCKWYPEVLPFMEGSQIHYPKLNSLLNVSKH